MVLILYLFGFLRKHLGFFFFLSFKAKGNKITKLYPKKRH